MPSMQDKLKKIIDHPRTWLRDDLLVRLLKNAGMLLSGNMLGSLFGIVSISITARALGTEGFGFLVMITTYVQIIDRLVNFQTWQAIIKYGSDALARDRKDDFRALIRFGFLLDGGTALLGTVLAASLAWFFGRARGWNESHVMMAALYSGTILFHINGTPTAILRLYDKFKKISFLHVIKAVIKVVGCAVALALNASLGSFLLVWAITDIAGKCMLIYVSLNELKRQDINRVPRRNRDNKGIAQIAPGIWGFVWTTNFSDSIRLATREIDVMLVGGILGASSVAVYKIGKQLAGVPQLIAMPIQAVIYPDIAKMVAAGRLSHGIRYGLKIGILLGGLGLAATAAALFLARPLIAVVFGAGYEQAHLVLIIFLLGLSVYFTGIAFRPIILSLGLQYRLLRIYLYGTAVFYAIYFPLVACSGINGAALSHLAFHLTWFALSYRTIARARVGDGGGMSS